jgi:hypothetical protein
MSGVIDVDGLRDATAEEIAFAEQTGVPASRVISAFHLAAVVPWLEDDATGAELGRRRMVAIEEALGTNLYLANTLGQWGISLTEVGDPTGALRAVERGRAVMEPGDVADAIILDVAEAFARASLGATGDALDLLARARATVAQTDAVAERNEIDYIEARVRAASGDPQAARELLESLVEHSTARGFTRQADRYRRDLVALDSRDRD